MSTYVLPPIASNEQLIWLDAWDNATLTTCADRLMQWQRKDGSLAMASAPSYAFGSNLTPRVDSATDEWRSTCISGNGKVVVCLSDDATTRVIVSYDGGQSFIAMDALNNLSGSEVLSEFAMSADGTVMVVGSINGHLAVSSNKGLSWQPCLTDSPRFWEWVAVSDDGKYMLASCFGDYVYASGDSGSQWRTLTDFPTDAVDVAFVYVSFTGQLQIIAYFDGSIHVSQNYGFTFTDLQINGFWSDLCVPTHHPNQLIVYTSPGYLYQSMDSGKTLIPILADQARDWVSVCISENGRIIAAAAANDSIYMSTNGGVSWGILDTGPQDWSAMVMNVNGELFATLDSTEQLSAPFIWRNGVLATGLASYDVRRSSMQSPLAIDASGRTFIMATYQGDINVNEPSHEPFIRTLNGKQAIEFIHSSLSIPRPLFTGSATDFTMIMAICPSSENSAPCFALSPNHQLTVTTGSSGMAVKWGSALLSVNRPLDDDAFTIVAVQVGSLTDPDLRLYLNGSKVLDRLGSIVEPPTSNGIIIGQSYAGDDTFSGYIGEIIMYRGDLRQNISGWNDVHSYLGRKFGVYAAIPQLSGIGSDPHLRQLTGGTYDVGKPGDYTLLAYKKTFLMTCHIASIKQGVFMDTLRITVGGREARVVFKSRSLKISQRGQRVEGDSLNLQEDTTESIKWDIYPTAPKKFIKVLMGCHPDLGKFWIRLDYKHRYMTPYFPQFNAWNECHGILVGEHRRVVLQPTEPKLITRPSIDARIV